MNFPQPPTDALTEVRPEKKVAFQPPFPPTLDFVFFGCQGLSLGTHILMQDSFHFKHSRISGRTQRWHPSTGLLHGAGAEGDGYHCVRVGK